jgi:predicted GIY-YIG superfamily endonuclease
MKTKPDQDPNPTAHFVYSIPCECGRKYIGEMGTPLAVRHREHKHNLREGYLEKSKLAKHALEEDHRIDWDNAKVLATESDSRYRKYKESAHMVFSDNPISQPSLDICPSYQERNY